MDEPDQYVVKLQFVEPVSHNRVPREAPPAERVWITIDEYPSWRTAVDIATHLQDVYLNAVDAKIEVKPEDGTHG